MIIGFFLIILGIIMAIYPQLLAIVVSFLFIFLGVALIWMSWQFKRTSSYRGISFLKFFFRI